MTVLAWILIVPFSTISVRLLYGFHKHGKLNSFSAVFMSLSIIITAISAGVLWGGLLG